ncbi:Endonuclease/exonuclease/phosphatase, partial [Trinorchestia longiramus]
FNTRSNIWGDHRMNDQGQLVEQLVLTNEIILLNLGQHTHFHCQTATTTAVDLTICSSTCPLDFIFAVLDDLHGSDHYPIQVEFVHLMK